MDDNRLTTLIQAALRLRCPVCKQGRIFAGWLRMNPACPDCGVEFEREEGYFLGSMYITFITTYLAGITAYLIGALMLGWSNTILIVGVLAGVLLIPLVIWRWARSAWLAFDQFVQPRQPPW